MYITVSDSQVMCTGSTKYFTNLQTSKRYDMLALEQKLQQQMPTLPINLPTLWMDLLQQVQSWSGPLKKYHEVVSLQHEPICTYYLLPPVNLWKTHCYIHQQINKFSTVFCYRDENELTARTRKGMTSIMINVDLTPRALKNPTDPSTESKTSTTPERPSKT